MTASISRADTIAFYIDDQCVTFWCQHFYFVLIMVLCAELTSISHGFASARPFRVCWLQSTGESNLACLNNPYSSLWFLVRVPDYIIAWISCPHWHQPEAHERLQNQVLESRDAYMRFDEGHIHLRKSRTRAYELYAESLCVTWLVRNLVLPFLASALLSRFSWSLCSSTFS